MAQLTHRRRQAEERLSDLRRSLARELGGYLPTRGSWAVPLVAFACGVALAFAAPRRKPAAKE
jgi:hypothetical protein